METNTWRCVLTTTDTYTKQYSKTEGAYKIRTPTKRLNILFISGLCGDGSEWDFLSNNLRKDGHNVTVYKNDPDKNRRDINSFTLGLRDFVCNHCDNERLLIVSHSLGCIAGLKAIMTIPEKVLGFIAICPSPQRGVWLPLKTVARNLRWSYIVGLITNKNVPLADSDARYFASGNGMTFSPDSPRLALGIGGAFGYWVPSLRTLSFNSVVINTSDDPVIGMRANKAVSRYHDTETVTLSCGGHYPHVHQNSRNEIERLVSRKIINWTKR